MHQPVGSSSTLPKDPVLRKEKLQDLMTQIQGTCNFMQVWVIYKILNDIHGDSNWKYYSEIIVKSIDYSVKSWLCCLLALLAWSLGTLLDSASVSLFEKWGLLFLLPKFVRTKKKKWSKHVKSLTCTSIITAIDHQYWELWEPTLCLVLLGTIVV